MTVVRCESCGAIYETDLPVRAVQQVRRCAQCGRVALVPQDEPERAQAGDEPPAPPSDSR